jgi:hypothetical protein
MLAGRKWWALIPYRVSSFFLHWNILSKTIIIPSYSLSTLSALAFLSSQTLHFEDHYTSGSYINPPSMAKLKGNITHQKLQKSLCLV